MKETRQSHSYFFCDYPGELAVLPAHICIISYMNVATLKSDIKFTFSAGAHERVTQQSHCWRFFIDYPGEICFFVTIAVILLI